MNSSPLDRVSLKNPVHLLALGFGSGLIRPAPGRSEEHTSELQSR